MGNKRIIDDVANEIFFAERDVDSADAHAQKVLIRPMAEDIFKIDVKFTKMKEFVAGLARHKVKFAKEIGRFPKWRLNEELGFIHTKRAVAIRTIRVAMKNANPTFAGEMNTTKPKASARRR